MAVETPVCVEEFHLIYNSSRAEAKVLMDFKASLASLASDKPEWMETWVGGTEHCLWERVTCQGGLVSGVYASKLPAPPDSLCSVLCNSPL